MKVLILGANGFIGSTLVRQLLEKTDWELATLDLSGDRLKAFEQHPRFRFYRGDFLKAWVWIETQIQRCDVVLPLVAIATPEIYVKDPLRIFELDFEANMRVVRLCARYRKRLIFPSTSEVYGMCLDREFDEDSSNLVLGPVPKSRWIYSCSKQLLDRVIWAYGEKEKLPFTLIRPFNWVGPNLDTVNPKRPVKSRSLTEFIANLLENKPIVLVDGGKQRRSFLDIEEGIDCLVKILQDKGKKTNGEILNIGFPQNEYSIGELAEMTRKEFQKQTGSKRISPIVVEKAESAYGQGYQDVQNRRPSIAKATRLLKWKPRIPLQQTVERTVSFYLQQR